MNLPCSQINRFETDTPTLHIAITPSAPLGAVEVGLPEVTSPEETSGSPGTCTTAIVGKNAGESRACAEHASGHFWSGPHSGMCLPVTCLTSLPVTWLPVAPPPPRPTEHSGWLLCEAWGCPFRSGWFANMVSSYAFVVIKGPSPTSAVVQVPGLPEVTKGHVNPSGLPWNDVRMRNRKLCNIRLSGAFWPEVTLWGVTK
jgi:hypothetical protein